MGLFDSAAQSAKPLFYGRIAVKDRSKPVFELTSKDTWAVTEVSAIDGNLTGLQYTENTDKEGKVIKGYRLTFDAPDGVLFLSIGFTQVGRSLMNSLLSLTKADNVRLSLYKNKEGYDNIGLTQNWEKISWKFPMSEVPRPEELGVVDWRKVLKWDNTNEFFKKHLDEKFIGTGFSFATPSNDFVASAHTESTPVASEDLPDMYEGHGSPWQE